MPELKGQTQGALTVERLLSSDQMVAQLKKCLPKQTTAERFLRVVQTEVRRTPKLGLCDPKTFGASLLQAAQLGLEPGINGQCWLVPYQMKDGGLVAQLIIGYRGYAQLAWRSGLVSSIAARAVFEGDAFSFDFGTDYISHKPCGESDPDKLTHAYAIIRTTTGGRVWDVMTRVELLRIRDGAASAKLPGSAWNLHLVEQCKKTVYRRAQKLGPCSVEMAQAMELDDAADLGEPQRTPIDAEFTVEATEKPRERQPGEEPEQTKTSTPAASAESLEI